MIDDDLLDRDIVALRIEPRCDDLGWSGITERVAPDHPAALIEAGERDRHAVPRAGEAFPAFQDRQPTLAVSENNQRRVASRRRAPCAGKLKSVVGRRRLARPELARVLEREGQ